MEDIDELADVLEVEADGGFLDEVEVGLSAAADLFQLGVLGTGDAFGELSDEFDALGFAATESWAGLA